MWTHYGILNLIIVLLHSCLESRNISESKNKVIKVLATMALYFLRKLLTGDPDGPDDWTGGLHCGKCSICPLVARHKIWWIFQVRWSPLLKSWERDPKKYYYFYNWSYPRTNYIIIIFSGLLGHPVENWNRNINLFWRKLEIHCKVIANVFCSLIECLFLDVGYIGYILLYALALFNASQGKLLQWDLLPNDREIIEKVWCYNLWY